MQRLDVFLVESGMTRSRQMAQVLIKSGGVTVDGKVATKCGQMIDQNNSKVEIVGTVCPYVSRAGYKLEGAAKSFGISFANKVVLDIGSSTGGFTDYAIKNGAKKVYSVDVGTNQLDQSLRQNLSVVVMENTDIRNLDKQNVMDIDIIVCDVSFISLTLISQKISELLEQDGLAVMLIKPQFECGKNLAKKHKGIIKDEKIHKLAINQVVENFKTKGLILQQIEESCIKGSDGNTEFVALFKKS